MNTAEALIKLLEEDGVKHIFGHPGEQILPFYKALKDSSIEHILTRHEQGAAHAADAYARSSGNYGLCISTAGPGAMNLVMGVVLEIMIIPKRMRIFFKIRQSTVFLKT